MLSLRIKYFLFILFIAAGNFCFAKTVLLNLDYDTESEIDHKIQSYFWDDYDSSRLEKKIVDADLQCTYVYYFYKTSVNFSVPAQKDSGFRRENKKEDMIFCLAFRKINNQNFEDDILLINKGEKGVFSWGRKCLVFPYENAGQKIFYLWNGSDCGYAGDGFYPVAVNKDEFFILGSTETVEIYGNGTTRLKKLKIDEKLKVLSNVELNNFSSAKIKQSRNIKYSFKNCNSKEKTPVFDYFSAQNYFPAGRLEFFSLQKKYSRVEFETKKIFGTEVVFMEDIFPVKDKPPVKFSTVRFSENGVERKMQKRVLE